MKEVVWKGAETQGEGEQTAAKTKTTLAEQQQPWFKTEGLLPPHPLKYAPTTGPAGKCASRGPGPKVPASLSIL